MKRKIAILGSTGSIGTQTLDIVRQHRDLFEVELISANNSVDLLISQAKEFDVNNVVICNPDSYSVVAEGLKGSDCKVFAGIGSLCSLAAAEDIDIVVGAMVGFSGLRPTLAALEAGKIVALAIGEKHNSDTFVVHIEKALKEYRGAYAIINQQFLVHEAGDCFYVNREDDTGDQGLRTAKLSYKPLYLLEKGYAMERKEPSC